MFQKLIRILIMDRVKCCMVFSGSDSERKLPYTSLNNVQNPRSNAWELPDGFPLHLLHDFLRAQPGSFSVAGKTSCSSIQNPSPSASASSFAAFRTISRKSSKSFSCSARRVPFPLCRRAKSFFTHLHTNDRTEHHAGIVFRCQDLRHLS